MWGMIAREVAGLRRVGQSVGYELLWLVLIARSRGQARAMVARAARVCPRASGDQAGALGYDHRRDGALGRSATGWVR